MKREEIKNLIPKGSVSAIAKENGISAQSIYAYLRGVSNSYKAEIACIKFINEVIMPKKKMEAEILNSNVL